MDKGFKAHLATLRRLHRSDVLKADAVTASINNRDWFHGEAATPQRRVLHKRLLDEVWQQPLPVSTKPQAVVLAGPPGAGKSTLASRLLGAQAHVLTIDADQFKVALLSEAVRDGTYESFLKPPEVKALEAQGERFFPLELATLVHAESARLAAQARRRALRSGVDVLIDTVLSDAVYARQLGVELDRAGYAVQVVDVEVPFNLSQDRIVRRWREAWESPQATGGLGGRWVPSLYAREVFDTDSGRARSQAAAQVLAETCPAVEHWTRYWQLAADTEPVKEVDKVRAERGGELR